METPRKVIESRTSLSSSMDGTFKSKKPLLHKPTGIGTAKEKEIKTKKGKKETRKEKGNAKRKRKETEEGKPKGKNTRAAKIPRVNEERAEAEVGVDPKMVQESRRLQRAAITLAPITIIGLLLHPLLRNDTTPRVGGLMIGTTTHTQERTGTIAITKMTPLQPSVSSKLRTPPLRLLLFNHLKIFRAKAHLSLNTSSGSANSGLVISPTA